MISGSEWETVGKDNEVNFGQTAFEKPKTYSAGNVQRGARSMTLKK